MSTAQVGFAYKSTDLDKIEKSLSTPRLSSYLIISKGDKRAAVRLYERNTDLSEALYGVLQGLEVTLRNSMDEALRGGSGVPNWYDHLPLEHPQAPALERAKANLIKTGKPLDPGRIIAELPFGFWSGLCSLRYLNTIWIPFKLHKAFRGKRVGRKDAHKRLDKIRLLRNRVAHHEPILSRNLKQDYREIIDTIAWICPVTASWVDSTNCFFECFNRKYD